MKIRNPLLPPSFRLLPAAALLAAFSAAFGATACSQYEAFDSAGHLRGEYAERVGRSAAASIEVPFELDAEVRAEVETKLRKVPNERREVDQVIDYIFGRLNLQYSLSPTRSASSTYRAREGNCLSFVNLFVGVARQQGLSPFYVEVTDYQKWNHREGMVVSQGHIVAGMYVAGELKTYDFLPYRPKAYKNFKPIDDLTAAAHYYNNLGAEALMAGDYEGAGRLLPVATKIDPAFVKGWNNLGVYLARSGRSDEALAVYRKGLDLEPDNVLLLTNVTRVYQETGRAEEAAVLLSKIEASNAVNPFFFIYEGEMALSRGETRKALDYLARALRQDTELPETHLAFVKVYLAMGEVDKAKHHLSRALTLDATNKEARRYAQMLGQ